MRGPSSEHEGVDGGFEAPRTNQRDGELRGGFWVAGSDPEGGLVGCNSLEDATVEQEVIALRHQAGRNLRRNRGEDINSPLSSSFLSSFVPPSLFAPTFLSSPNPSSPPLLVASAS